MRPRSPKFRTFWWAVEIALWTMAGICIVFTRGGDLCIALLLAATAVGLALASTDKRPRY